MNRTNCKTYFSITGEFDPNKLSDILKIDRTGGHFIGGSHGERCKDVRYS